MEDSKVNADLVLKKRSVLESLCELTSVLSSAPSRWPLPDFSPLCLSLKLSILFQMCWRLAEGDNPFFWSSGHTPANATYYSVSRPCCKSHAHVLLKLLFIKTAPFVWSCCIQSVHSVCCCVGLSYWSYGTWDSSLKLMSLLSAHSFSLLRSLWLVALTFCVSNNFPQFGIICRIAEEAFHTSISS